MFIASGVELVIAQCTSGVIGTFPALNARSAGQLDEWLCQIGEALAAHDRDEFPLSPPTVLTLQEISNSFAAHGSLPSMLAAEGERQVATVLPKAISGPTENFTLMPWHPDYHTAPGEGVPAGIDYPAHLLSLPGRVNRKHDFSGKPLP